MAESSDIRDAIFHHEIFDVKGAAGCTLEGIRREQRTWSYNASAIEAELKRLQDEGFVEPSAAGQGEDAEVFWHPTPAGYRAREGRWQEMGYRHPALSSPETNLDDLIVALVASGGDESDLFDSFFPKRDLGVFLQKHSVAEIEARLANLMAEGLIARIPPEFFARAESIRLTTDGRIHYRRVLVAKLGLCPPYTILAPHADAAPDFELIIADAQLAQNLKYRWEEAERCNKASAYLAACILLGSILETLMLGVLLQYPSLAYSSPRAPKPRGENLPIDQWSLDAMLSVAADLKWIDSSVHKLALGVREARNLVHPAKQAKDQTHPDDGLVQISERIVKQVTKSLAAVTSKNFDGPPAAIAARAPSISPRSIPQRPER